ncbi:hypothetical protein, partial [Burkholderia ubonensis]|uniref:hypothetical protein n=1 Tax=Burkholderia ubonensis TaxID=101571 RepID=UPI001C433EF3
MKKPARRRLSRVFCMFRVGAELCVVREAELSLNLSAFLWVRRLNKSLATRLRESLTEQDSKLVHGGFPVEGR